MEQLMEQKRWSTALILSFFLGVLGIDRLYLGYRLWWLKLITIGGLGIAQPARDPTAPGLSLLLLPVRLALTVDGSCHAD